MELEQYQHFLVLAQTLHYGQAAQNLGVSASALTRSIQKIEGTLGHSLFIRDKRSVRLSQAGHLFRAHALEASKGWAELKAHLDQENDSPTGDLKIFCSVTACYSVLPDLLAPFRRAYPGGQIHLQTGDAADAMSKVLDGVADLTITAVPDQLPSRCIFNSILKTPLVFIHSPNDPNVDQYRDGQALDWSKIPMVLPERGLARERINGGFAELGIRPKIYAEVSGHEAILAMVNLGFGVGVVPALVLEKSPYHKTLSILPSPKFSKPLAPYDVGLCMLKRDMAHSPLKQFWDLVLALGGGEK
ncbi:MAG: HTH-type transcriptional activator IlvY [Verrucomicrobia bacterium]|nr:HTH-type transcriptional activator IlvY [Verrucomicrobiota bacterium]